MPSSTTSPVARTIARRVSTLIENPKMYIRKNDPTNETGISISGRRAMTVFLKKRNTMSTTRLIAISMVSATSVTDCLMNLLLSKPTSSFMPAGRFFLISSKRLKNSSAMAIWLEPGNGISASEMPDAPFNFTPVSSTSAPRIASPISLSRMSWSLVCLMIMLLKSSSVVRRPNVLTMSSVDRPLTFPPGRSTFSLISAMFTSSAVRLYAAIFFGSSQSRIAGRFCPNSITELTPGIV